MLLYLSIHNLTDLWTSSVLHFTSALSLRVKNTICSATEISSTYKLSINSHSTSIIFYFHFSVCYLVHKIQWLFLQHHVVDRWLSGYSCSCVIGRVLLQLAETINQSKLVNTFKLKQLLLNHYSKELGTSESIRNLLTV